MGRGRSSAACSSRIRQLSRWLCRAPAPRSTTRRSPGCGRTRSWSLERPYRASGARPTGTGWSAEVEAQRPCASSACRRCCGGSRPSAPSPPARSPAERQVRRRESRPGSSDAQCASTRSPRFHPPNGAPSDEGARHSFACRYQKRNFHRTPVRILPHPSRVTQSRGESPTRGDMPRVRAPIERPTCPFLQKKE
jgi:hypothetical protein